MNQFEIIILEDGTLKIESEEFSESLHLQADQFIEEIELLLGTKRQTSKKEHPYWKNRIVQRGGKVIKV